MLRLRIRVFCPRCRTFGVQFATALAVVSLFLAGVAAGQEKASSAPKDGELQFAELGTCRLESGQVLEDCRIGYRTFGLYDPSSDNAVLMPSWLYGNSADLAGLFGDGSRSEHLVDPRRFFGIAVDAFANGVSSSPSNSSKQPATSFPALTLRDSVEAQYRLLTEVLHVRHLHAVVGLSMGGEQAFDWAVLHPEFVSLAIPILGTPRLTVYDLQLKQITLESITRDPDYADGHYKTEPKLGLANLLGNLVVTSPEFRNHETKREDLPAFLATTEAAQPIDANDRVWQLRAIMRQDVIGKRSVSEAARATPVRFLVIVSGRDPLVQPQPALDWAAAVGAPTYISQGACAHLIMTCDAAAVASRVRAFLAQGKLP